MIDKGHVLPTIHNPKWSILNLGTLLMSIAATISIQAQTPTAQVQLTGHLLEINGVDIVPKGLFGVHAMNGLTDEIAQEWGIESIRTIEKYPDGQPRRPGTGQGHGYIPRHIDHIVECWFDRYQPAFTLTEPKHWEKSLTKLAKRWAKQVSHSDIDHTLEFWNEPYLNWANKPGVNYDGQFFSRRGDQVLLHGKPQPDLAWTRRKIAIDPKSGRVDYVASRYMPSNAEVGSSFKWRNMPWTVREDDWVYDRSQPSWWSGYFNREQYHTMLSAFGPAMHKANPEAKLVVGWGFHIYQDGWQAWDLLHRPLIDLAAPWMTGYNEHHYGGDVRAVAGSYEVAYAYALATHGKKIKLYNTEAGGFLDPERPGPSARSGPDGMDMLNRQIQGTAYMLRDVIHMIDVCPDKAVARAAHMPDQYGGEAAFKLLKPLRGRLLEVQANQADLWAVASFNDGQICLVVFNDSNQTKSFALNLGNLQPGRDTELTRHETQIVDGQLRVVDNAQTIDNSLQHDLESRSAAAWTWAVEEDATDLPLVSLEAFVADQARQDIQPGETLETTVKISKGRIAAAEQARIKLVRAPWLKPDGNWQIQLNGQPLELVEPTGGAWISWTPIDISRLDSINRFTFTNPQDASKTIGMDALSIELIDRP
jgi:hypothetical protein